MVNEHLYTLDTFDTHVPVFCSCSHICKKAQSLQMLRRQAEEGVDSKKWIRECWHRRLDDGRISQRGGDSGCLSGGLQCLNVPRFGAKVCVNKSP